MATEQNRNALLIGAVGGSSIGGCGLLRGNVYSNKRAAGTHEQFFMDSSSGTNTNKSMVVQPEIYNKYQRGGNLGDYDEEDSCQLEDNNDNIVDCVSPPPPVNLGNSSNNNNNNNNSLLDV